MARVEVKDFILHVLQSKKEEREHRTTNNMMWPIMAKRNAKI